MSVFSSGNVSGKFTPELGDIISGLQKGDVIPFLGAGASANSLNGSTDYKNVLKCIQGEMDSLSRLAKGDGKDFMIEFEKKYLAERKNGAFKASAAQEADDERANKPRGEVELRAWERANIWKSKEMRDFRLALANLIVSLTASYRNAIGGSKQFFFSHGDKITCAADPDLVKEAFQALTTLHDKLEDLSDVTSDRIVLDRSKLDLNVETGIWFFGRVLARLHDRYDSIEGAKRSPRINSDHLIWLSDILWLSIVIWFPLYPTTRELLTEMSVMSDKKTRSAEQRLVRAAECFTNLEELSTYICWRFGKFQQEKAWPGALIMDSHAAVASSLIHTARVVEKSSYEVVVYTTNFDNGLELAVEKIIRGIRSSGNPEDKDLGYRVIFPVFIKNPDSMVGNQDNRKREATFRLKWAARDWFPDETDPRNGTRWIVETQTGRLKADEERREARLGLKLPGIPSQTALRMCTTTRDQAPDIRGPVIVKLHGGPLESLAGLLNDPSQVRENLRHYTVFSEWQYIDTIIKSADTAPSWLTKALEAHDVMFLGYSIEDWNIRLHLARQPQRTIEPDTDAFAIGNLTDASAATSKAEIRRSAIVRSPSAADKILFERLGIGLAENEIGRLVRLMIDSPSINKVFSHVGYKKPKYLDSDFPDSST